MEAMTPQLTRTFLVINTLVDHQVSTGNDEIVDPAQDIYDGNIEQKRNEVVHLKK